MSHRLLFVCAMNVCRSPLMAFTFADALAQDSDRTGWTVASRGTSVARRDRMCDVSASLITGSNAGQSFLSSHVSAPIAVSQLNAQDLIIVATKSERGKVAHLNPDLRARTFTPREAIALGRPPVVAAEVEAATRRQQANQRLRLGGYPALLNARRGTVPMPIARKPLPFFGRPQPDPLDVPDVHHEKPARHLEELRAAQAEVRTLHVQIRDFLGARVGAN